jgi:flagellar capping protein FliD
MTAKTYSQEEHDIALLQDRTSNLGQTLERVDHRLDSVDRRLETLESTIRSQFSTTMNYIIGVYGLILTVIIAHVGKIF